MSLVSLFLNLTGRQFFLDSAQNRQSRLVSYRVAQPRLTSLVCGLVSPGFKISAVTDGLMRDCLHTN